MQLHSYNSNTGGVHRVWLYSVVFAGKLSGTAVFMLFLSFVVQPFHQAMANEVENTNQSPVSLPQDVVEQLPSPSIQDPTKQTSETNSELSVSETSKDKTLSDEVTATGLVTETINDQVSTLKATTTDTKKTKATSASSTQTGIISMSTNTSSGTTVNEGHVSGVDSLSDYENNDPSSTTTSSVTTVSTEDGSETTVDENIDIFDSSGSSAESDGSTNIEEATFQNESDKSSTTADDLINSSAIEQGVNSLVDGVVNEVVNLTRQLVTEENFYQFSRQSCVPVGDGTFHCTDKARAAIDPESAVFAQLDDEGDTEIFMRTSKGDVKQLTNNVYEDSSPDLDLASMRVVWQRVIDGRYQIISYDLNERVETQLTFSRTNSMEPKVSKEGIVWQAWDGNDWEIMFFDGQFTDQITDNEVQDVTPVVEDGYVLWSVLGGEASEARVYSIEDGQVMTIAGHDGGTVLNPRFVLVYDTRFENGDVVTQGFDPITGLAQPISAKPAELPFDIPEADPIGEIRALIQNKSTQKDKEVVTVPVADNAGDLNLSSSTATSSDTLNLVTQYDLEQIGQTPVDGAELVLDEYDLVITPVASSTTATINKAFHATSSASLSISSSTTTTTD